MARKLLITFTALLLISALSAGVYLASPGLLGNDIARQDRTRLQGTWKLVKMIVDGKEFTDEEVKETYRLTFKGDRYDLQIGGGPQAVGHFKISADQNPKSMDILEGEGMGAVKTHLGIYKLEGDTLTICVHDRERPTRFTVEPGRDGCLLILKRAQP